MVWYSDEEKAEISARLFGDAKFLNKVDDDAIGSLLKRANVIGQDAAVEEFRRKRKKRQDSEKAAQEHWQKIFERFGGTVIGMDAKIDVFATGFSVRVLFNSSVGFDGRKKFIVENQRDFLLWLMDEIKDSKRIMKRIGDMSFYKPVEIINMRQVNEAEVKFEIKEAAQ